MKKRLKYLYYRCGARRGYGVALLVLCCCLLASGQAQTDGVCAKVGLRLDQSAVMTRTAFRATLELSNHDPSSALTSVSAQVEVKDTAGQIATSRFSTNAPVLDSIGRVDGAGTIAANSTATIRWLLIPTDEAAPTNTTQYFVGGQFSYELNGNHVVVPLDPVSITVHPDAALDLQYFHQRDVFSDDPFTPEIEPAQPYALAVMVKNRGAGPANSLKITSAQPQIVSNEKGLIIDFKLVSAVLDGQNAANSLALDFGEIDPGGIKTAEWLFTSSLQGFFRDFNATFQHQDSLGNSHLSTIKSISIHEMTHIVEAGYQFADGKPDFLVNDAPDAENLPDTLYLSDGSTNQVQAVQQFAIDTVPSATNLQVRLTAPLPTGWAYLQVPEPSGGQFVLTGVTRSDGVQLKVGTNVWTTDRTFVAPGQPAIRTNVLHLLDYNSSGVYTLFYGVPPPPDINAPVSLVAALSASSPLVFPVQWSGQDDTNGSGIAYFDIFVSVNNGQFTTWLQHTTLRGATYSGTLGNTYAFYSVATDVAGNSEPAHTTPDAQTAVNLANHAPVLASIANQNINEGDTLSLIVSATDPDANLLIFSVGPGAPAGVTITPNSGLLTWATGEAQGPSTNVITVIVRDNGVPSLSDSRTFTVVVNEVNQPPSLAALPPQTINEGETLRLPILASDPDLPPNHLAFALEPGAPAGATIDPATGVLTWATTEADGGTTKQFTVRVTDDGSPSMSATQTYTVVVNEVNTPPVLAAIPTQTVDEGTTLSFAVAASDSDRPANLLTFSLGTGSPTNASINPITGVFTWTPSEEQGPSTNGIKLVVTDNGVPSMSATQTVTIVVNEVNTAPTLVTVSNQVAYVFTRLTVTNRVVDPDIPTNSFTFKLGSGAPAGVEIATNSGVLSWTPLRDQAPSTNVITVIVTDDGVPPLSATNSFSVVVGDYLELSLGSAVLQAGQSGSVPINFMSSTGVTNLNFVLTMPEDRLTNLVLQSLAPQIGASSLQSVGPNRSTVNLAASDGQVLQGTQLLAQLSFVAVSNQTSAFVPLIMSDLAGIQGNGLLVPKTLVNNGRVVVVGNQSLLEALVSTNDQGTLVLYGIPGTNYVLESTASLGATASWQTVWQGQLTNLLQVFQGLSITNEAIFYRVRQ